MRPELIPITPYGENSNPVRIKRLPAQADLEEAIQATMGQNPPFALLLPPGPDVYIARTASMLRDTLHGRVEILIPLGAKNRLAFRGLMDALRREGFRNFAFPPRIEPYDMVQLVQFLGHPTFREGEWYHLAYGRDPGEMAVPGVWTWSEETI